MFDSLVRIFRSNTSSAQVAKNRLQLVLAQDRIGLSEETIEQLKYEIINVISKYFEVDHNSLEIEILNQDGKSALTVNTPVYRRA